MNHSEFAKSMLASIQQQPAGLPEMDLDEAKRNNAGRAMTQLIFGRLATSGTAAKLAQYAAAGRDRDLSDIAVYGREGMVGERPRGEIGIHAVRAGDIVGEHTVLFSTPGERIELVHRAHSRDTFARGALRAARFSANAGPGFYNMRDVLKSR